MEDWLRSHHAAAASTQAGGGTCCIKRRIVVGNHLTGVVVARRAPYRQTSFPLNGCGLCLCALRLLSTVAQILYAKPLLHESDTTLKALPEIHHRFREQEQREPWIVSLVFTGLVFVPLAAFVAKVGQTGGDLSLISGTVQQWGKG